LASAAMAAFLVWFGGDVQTWLAASTSHRLIWLTGIVSGGGAVYFAVLWLLGVRMGQFRLAAATPVAG
jgi:putative peptidoglycan lipid II flippase